MIIDVDKWNKIYENNKRLDKIFYEKYKSDEKIFRKNCLEFLTELGEFLNETKVFKYWSIKKPIKEKVLEEYADNLTICLTFFREKEITLKRRYYHTKKTDVLEIANDLYGLISFIMYHCSKDLLENIFGNLLYLGSLLGINEDEAITAIEKKHKIIEERLNSDY